MKKELLTIIESLKTDFSYDKISDYQNLLLILYNSLFVYEDELTSDLKYKIYELLSTVINTTEKNQYYNLDKSQDLTEDFKTLEFLIPMYLRDGINPRYNRIPSKNKRHINNIERLKK